MATIAAPIGDKSAGQEPDRVSSRAKHRWFSPERLQVAGIALGFLALCLRAAWLRSFWFDELSTLFVTATPTLRAMFHAIPTDGNPPLYFLLARLSLHLSLKSELTLRLPAVLAYLGAGLAVYLFVKRNACHFFALTAMILFLGAGVHLYAFEARPYSLLMLFTGIVLCCWQAWCRTRKPIYLGAITLGTVGAICSHQYGVIYVLAPLAAGEVVRGLRRRRVDWRVTAAVAGGSLTICLTYPPVLRAQKILLDAIRACPVFWAHPRLSDLKDYLLMIPYPVPFLVGLAVLFVMVKLALRPDTGREEIHRTRIDRIPPEDLGAAAALTLILPLMLVVTHLGTNYFQVRYGIGSAMGISMLAGMLSARFQLRHAKLLAQGVIFYSVAFALIDLWSIPKPKTPHPWNDPVLQGGDQQEPIVIASALQFSPTWWYSDGQMRSRLYYLADLPYAGRHSDILPEYSLALEHAYTPMQMSDYHEFLSTHSRFLLYCYGQPRLEWIKQRLMQSGWHLRLLKSAIRPKSDDDDGQPYRELFEVTR